MSIYKKLFEAKKEIEAITKDTVNPFFKKSYFDINKILSEIEPILQKNNLILLQPIIDNKVRTEIRDAEKDGTTETSYVYSEMHLPSITDPQKLGSAITYYRRYTLQSLLGLQAEDDDANTASKATKPSDNKKWLNNPSKDWTNIELKAKEGKINMATVLQSYKMRPELKTKLELLFS